MIINEKITSLSSYKHDVLFKKYNNITLYKITSDIFKSEDNSSLNKLLTLYEPYIDESGESKNNEFNKFNYCLTHQPKIYSITKDGYSENPINNEYFQNIENWLNENSDSRENDLKTFFSYRGNETNINNEVIQNCIFDDSEE